MKIIYYDGGTQDCLSITFTEKELIVDDIYIVPIIEVQGIIGE